MYKIPIFTAEKKDGISDQVSSNASIAYYAKAKPMAEESRKIDALEKFYRSSASHRDQPDLFYLDTLLVSTGYNKNEDIFDIIETWAARASAEDKPFNLGHNQLDIIGHITSNSCVNDDLEFLDEALAADELPDKFHIITSAVIYKVYEDKARAKQIDKIIGEIPDGKWFVSMECLFRGFDYGLMTATGESKVLPRTEETSYLTKYLKVYGGKGKYQDYTIGRVLKGITFSGKGLVENPANPDSIIFNSVANFKSEIIDLGYLKNVDSKQFTTKGAAIMATEAETILKAEHEYKIQGVTDRLTASEKEVEKTKKEKDELSKSAEKIQADLQKQITELTAAKEKLEKDLKDEKEKSVKAEKDLDAEKETMKEFKRAAKAMAKGASEENAVAFAKSWTNLTDAQYENVLPLVQAETGDVLHNGKVANKKLAKTEEEVTAKPTEVKTEKPSKTKSKAKVDDDDEEDEVAGAGVVLNNVVADKDAALATASTETNREALSKFLGSTIASTRKDRTRKKNSGDE